MRQSCYAFAAGLSLLGSSIVTAGGLSVVSVTPTSHSLAAPTGTSISVTFDRAVDRASVDANSFWAFGRWSGTVSGAYSYSNGDQTVTLHPGHAFSSGEQVLVILSHDLAGVDESPLRNAGYSFQFWTRGMPAGLDFIQVETHTTNAKGESSQPYGGIGCDVNGDGWLDISLVNEITQDLRVFLNKADGTGSYDPFIADTIPLNAFASPSEPADFNHDGNVDLCVANQGSDTISVLLGVGDGTFVALPEIGVGILPNGIAVLDADGDGDVDMVNVNNSSGNLCYHENLGLSSFAPPVFFDGGITGERALSATDMNNDGILDLVIGGFSPPTSTIRVMTGNGDGTFTGAGSQSFTGASWMLVTGDLDGDGNADASAVSGAFNNVNNGAFLLGDGAGNLAAASLYPLDSWPLSSDLGDMDGDGDLDWVAASFNGDFQFYLNDGTGTFTFERCFVAPSAASCSLALDIDNDRDLDFAFIDETADLLFIWKNSGTTAVGDVNGDGVVDFGDILVILASWGPCGSCPADLDNNGSVEFNDILIVLSNWTATRSP